MTNQTIRVLELLKRFNNGQKVCIEALQNDSLWWSNKTQESMSEKSIRRDLNVIKKSFPESFKLIQGEKGCYKAITTQAFNNFMKPEILSLMVQTFNMASRSDLFDNFNLDKDDKKIISKKVKELNNIYDFKNKPFENAKSNSKILKIIERSIKNQKSIIIQYSHKDKIENFEIMPYKIVFIYENFYLACEVENKEFKFSMFRISRIKTIKDIPKTFHKNYDIENFIKDIQTPFALYKPNYKEYQIKVILEVQKIKVYFFKAKKHLKSQEILETKKNGNIIIQYMVTQDLEVEELIKKWLPYIKIISPLSLKNKIEKELKQYLLS
jgi:predicted DNA-binding transcriptional regulator YafY